MRRSSAILIAVLALPALANSCKRKPAEPVGAAPMQAAPALPTPPPPRPACESLEEKCQALPETELDVPTTSASFKPPASWNYAKEPTFAVAFPSGGNAGLVFTRAASSAPEAVQAALDQLFLRLEIGKVKPASLKARLKKPDSVVPGSGAELKLWELDRKNLGAAPELKGKPGTLLVVVATVGEDVVVGAGFVVKPEAEAEAPAIMTSVQSLHGVQR